MPWKMELRNCRKGYTYDQDKAIRPEETVKRALERINSYGVPLIKSFHKVNNYFDIPQYRIDTTIYVQNHSKDRQHVLKGTNGKGAVDEQARASCVMEFIERFSVNSYDRWKNCRHEDFAAGEVVPLESIGKTLNYAATGSENLLKNLKSIPMDWAEAYNFTSGKNEYIPKLFLDVCSTGLAAGNTVEEAVLQAICECVERHSGACIQWGRGEYPTVRKGSISNPVIVELIKKLEVRGMEVLIKDFSGILGIPTLGVILFDKEYRDDIGHAIGVCCDKDKALIRAFTESVQSSGMRTATMLKNPSVSFYFDTYKAAEFLLKGKTIDFSDVMDIGTDDIKTEIERCIKILGETGKEVLVVDLEEPKIKMPAVWVYLKNSYLVYSLKPLALYLSRLYILNGQWTDAVSSLEKLKENGEINNDLYFYTAIAYKGLGEHRKAIKYFDKALSKIGAGMGKKDDAGDTYLYMGMSYFELKEYDKALEYYSKSKDIDANKDILYYNIGIAYQSKKKYDKAVLNLEKVLEINPEFSQIGSVYVIMGWCLLESGKNEAAIERFKAAAGKSAAGMSTYFGLGMALKRIGRCGEALASFEKALLEKNSREELAGINFNIGECYEAERNYDKALKYFEKALDGGTRSVVMFKLGMCWQNKEDYPKAVKYFEDALETQDEKSDQDLGEIYLRIGICLSLFGEYDKSVKLLEKSLKFHVDENKLSMIKYHLGLGYQMQQRYKEALKIFKEAYGGSTDEKYRGEIKNQIGYSCLQLGDKSGAKEALKEAIKHNPVGAENYNILGMIYREDREDDKAIEVLKEGIKQAPDRWENYNLIGVCYRDKGDTAAAVKALEEAIRLNAGEWRNYNILGRILIGLNETERAKKLLKTAMDLCGDAEYRDKISKLIAVI